MKNISEDAIIGYSGYIGSFLLKKIKFKYKFNSRNIGNLKKKSYRNVYLSAPHSLKYWANQNPKKDTIIVNNLIKYLKDLNCEKIIYFSSTDIYHKKKKVNEDTKISKKNSSVYGANRFKIEKFIKKNFNNYLIIRLPALFGGNLKKNFFYDLVNSKSLKYYNKETYFQWYFIEWLVKDIIFIFKKKIKLINLISEPLRLLDIVEYLDHKRRDFSKTIKPVSYNILSKHIINKNNLNYHYSKKEILRNMKAIYYNNY